MKIAVVKSSVYQDLWVTNITNNAYDLFKTSMVRCPPVGLAEEYSADFIIVKDTDEYPCNSNKNCLDTQFTDSIKFSKERKNPGLPFLHEGYHKDISIDSIANLVDSIDWPKYNIVMCINTCIPRRIIEQYPEILWCYWVGENDEHLVMNKIDCYDIVLNQDVTKQGLSDFSIGFPYTYVSPYTIERIVKFYFTIDSVEKRGVYMEINNTTERPVISIPSDFLAISQETGHPIVRHLQDILENAKNLFTSKYYVKLLGRKIRGNSTLECISAGTLVLANDDLLMYPELILQECKIKSYTDAIDKINFFDANPSAYNDAIQRQREILNLIYFKKPYDALIEKYMLLKCSNK
jgi:hypothetical protein